MRRLWILTATLALILSGCTKESTTGPGEGGGGGTGGGAGSGTGNLVVEAAVTPEGAWVILKDSTGAPITGATVTINGRTLSSSPIIGGYYFDSTVVYRKGQTYELRVDAPNYGSAQATAQAPQIDSLKITDPTSGAQFNPGDPIPVSWTYYGGQNDGSVGVSFSYRDTTTYFSGELSGSTTSHTIPGSATAQEGTARIFVSAGRYIEISGLADSSYFAVGTYDEVQVTIGQGGGGTGDWAGTLEGTLNGQEITGSWYYTAGYFGGVFASTAGGDTTYFYGQISSWPPQNAWVYTQTGLVLSFTGTVQGNQVSGTWEAVFGGTGSGTWEGSRQ